MSSNAKIYKPELCCVKEESHDNIVSECLQLQSSVKNETIDTENEPMEPEDWDRKSEKETLHMSQRDNSQANVSENCQQVAPTMPSPDKLYSPVEVYVKEELPVQCVLDEQNQDARTDQLENILKCAEHSSDSTGELELQSGSKTLFTNPAPSVDCSAEFSDTTSVTTASNSDDSKNKMDTGIEYNAILEESTVSDDQESHSGNLTLQDQFAAMHNSLTSPMQNMTANSNDMNNYINNTPSCYATEFSSELARIIANGCIVSPVPLETPRGDEINGGKKANQRVLQCEYCEYTTWQSGHMKLHVRRHTGDKLQCPHCEYQTCQSGNLKAHIRNHTGDMLQCPHCDYKTCWKANMKEHNRKHVKDILLCPHCEYTTYELSAQKAHLRTHTGDNLLCPYCEYKTYRPSTLKAHVRKHTGDMLQCPHCEYKACYATNLKRHQRSKHSIEN